MVLVGSSPEIPSLLIDDFKSMLSEEGLQLKRRIEETLKNAEPHEFNTYLKRLFEALIELLGKAIRYAIHAGQFFECLYAFLMHQLAEVWHLSIRLRMNDWMQEQAAYLNTQYSHKKQGPAEKLILDLTVAQLGCMARALVGGKTITDENVTKISRVLAASVLTRRSIDLSAHSLKKSYYDSEAITKKQVIDLLQRAIDWLRKN